MGLSGHEKDTTTQKRHRMPQDHTSDIEAAAAVPLTGHQNGRAFAP